MDTSPAPRFDASIVITEEAMSLASQCAREFDLAKEWVIDSQVMADEAVDKVHDLREKVERLKKVRDGFLRPAKEIMDNASALFGPGIAAVDNAIAHLRQALLAWNEQEQRRVEEQARAARLAAEEARRKAEAEAAAEVAKAQEEARRLREKAAEAQEKADKTGSKAAIAEAARAEAGALAAIERGNDAAAEALVSASASVPVVQQAKTKGFHTTDTYEAEVTDFAEFFTQVAGRRDLWALVTVDQKALNRMANVWKDDTPLHLDGVKVKKKSVPVVEGKRR